MEAPISTFLDAMSKLPAKLDRLLRHGQMLPRGAEHEIPLIKQDLQKMIAILQNHGNSTAMVRCLMKEVRELSYDMEDCIDQYEHAADSSSRSGFSIARRRRNKITRRDSKSTLPEKLKRRLWMANKMREFSVRSQEALQRYFDHGGTSTATRCDASSFGSWHPPQYGERADCLVGIDAPMNILQQWLTKDGEHKLKVVSIVGPGGVGKTTLADELYRRICGQFECQAFLRTSHKPDIRRLLISMLSQIRPHQPARNWKVHSLIAYIKTHLQDKRYLIVIDDVWATSTWDIVNCALPDGNRCSRILITTEIEDVSLKCCGYDPKYVFKMKPLGEDDSRKLFFSTAVVPPEFSEVSNRIVRKCGGLPLATVTIASLLASQMGKPEQWDHVDKSLGYNLRTNPTLEGMTQVLNLSYSNLPQHLKACMLYFSIYQEDYIIWKDDLIKQWIVEGFICANEEKDEEEISRSYFDELIDSRMIQPVHINDNDEVLSCTVHHMVLNFITHKSIQENFVTPIDHSQTGTRLADKVRRLSLQYGNAQDATPPTNMRLSQVRTLAFFGVFKCVPSFVEFHLLQVLILNIWGDEESISLDITKISELFRLRYLQVTCNVTLELQTQMLGVQYLPRLLHLNLPAETNLPDGIGHITSLCTLGHFNLSSNSSENVQSLGGLTNLQDLQITYCTVQSDNLMNNMQCLGSILGKLSNLKSLTLVPAGSSHVAGGTSMTISGDGLSSVSSPPALLRRLELLPCIFSRLPEWIGHLAELCILEIAVCELATNDVHVLGGLPALTVMSLSVHTKLAERIVFHKGAFSLLKYFKFRCSVPWLKFEADAMPNLRKLKISFSAPRLDLKHGSAPISIEYLSDLKEISAEIWGARGDAQSALMTAVSNHPSNPRINVQLVDRNFYGNESTSMGTSEVEHWNLELQDEILEEHTDECYKTQDEDKKQAGSRISMLSESSSCMPVPGSKYDTFFKAGPWLDSGNEDDLHRVVTGDFLSSRGITVNSLESSVTDQLSLETMGFPKGNLKELLIGCAKAVAEKDRFAIDMIIPELGKMVSVSGEPLQRLGAYMLEGLVDRLASSDHSIYKVSKFIEPTSSEHMNILYEFCPYFKFGYMSANGAIARAVKGEDRIHIIDFCICQGSQWVTLLLAFGARSGGPPTVRITCIDDLVSASPGGRLELVGRRLYNIAHKFHVPFEFHAVAISGGQVEEGDLRVIPGEALAVNFMMELHHIPDENVGTANHRDRILRLVKSLSPKVVTLVEQEANTNTAPFFPRFLETLDYYTAVFESIDVALSRDDKRRISMEQHCLAREMGNLVACEGAERVERHELFGKWKARFMMAGFTPSPLSTVVNANVRRLLQSSSSDYRCEERDGVLYLGWKNRTLVVSSAWH